VFNTFRYPTVEQYVCLVSCKLVLFANYLHSYYQARKLDWAGQPEEIIQAIQDAPNPSTARRLGRRKIAGFDSEGWAEERRRVISSALYLKFVQWDDLRAQLEETGDRPLYKANSSLFWGLGINKRTRRRAQREPNLTPIELNAVGQNEFGRILTTVRQVFRLMPIEELDFWSLEEQQKNSLEVNLVVY